VTVTDTPQQRPVIQHINYTDVFTNQTLNDETSTTELARSLH